MHPLEDPIKLSAHRFKIAVYRWRRDRCDNAIKQFDQVPLQRVTGI
jgi:hypothetical protein